MNSECSAMETCHCLVDITEEPIFLKSSVYSSFGELLCPWKQFNFFYGSEGNWNKPS